MTQSDKDCLIQKSTNLSQRDAVEEPSDDEIDGFVEVEPVNKVQMTNHKLPKPKYDPGEHSYQALDDIRARKAQQRAEKMKKASQRQKVGYTWTGNPNPLR